MITDQETNVVYFSRKIIENGFNNEYRGILSILENHGIDYSLIEGTKDVWCRDYMPIQVSNNEFVRFNYEPWYLNDTEENKKLKSNPKVVCELNGFDTLFSEINLDGGNVVKSKQKVILTDRIFDENKTIEKSKLIKELEKLFKAEILIIPQIKSDMTGHADGLVRFFDNETILVNELKNEYKYWQYGMKRFLSDHHLHHIEVPWFVDKRKDFKRKFPNSAIGLYINFLEVGNLIILPKFEIEGNKDEETDKLFKEIYPDRTIEAIQINEIAKGGGILNCITWNIKK
jgi:agmatine deiminase